MAADLRGKVCVVECFMVLVLHYFVFILVWRLWGIRYACVIIRGFMHSELGKPTSCLNYGYNYSVVGIYMVYAFYMCGKHGMD